jgi:CO/xanthine dehydrogenase Mo-binding subunit
VIKAAAEADGWDARPSPKPMASGDILTGRGIAYAFRSQTVVAQIAEVEVNRPRAMCGRSGSCAPTTAA